MIGTSIKTRAEVVAEALTWIGTPYHKNGRVKGAGVDCATLLFCVYMNCGLVPSGDEGIFTDPEIVPIGQDWWCNTNEDKYLRRVVRYAHKVAQTVGFPTHKAKPGNLILTKCRNSRLFNHGGIVIDWPIVVHAVDPDVEKTNVLSHCLWAFQETAVFDPWERPI